MGYLKSQLSEVNLEEAASRAATLKLSGVGINEIVKQLSQEFEYNFTRTQVVRFEQKEIYQDIVAEYHKSLKKKALNFLISQAEKLTPKVIAAIERGLDNDNMQAVVQALKIIGVENLDPEQKQSQNLTVIMPGARPKEKVIDVTKKDEPTRD